MRTMMSGYGEVKDVHGKTWTLIYRYPVANGISIAVMTLGKQIPSNSTIDGHTLLVSYEDQPMTCYIVQ